MLVDGHIGKNGAIGHIQIAADGDLTGHGDDVEVNGLEAGVVAAVLGGNGDRAGADFRVSAIRQGVVGVLHQRHVIVGDGRLRLNGAAGIGLIGNIGTGHIVIGEIFLGDGELPVLLA